MRKTARSCHLSVLRMKQTDELVTKRVLDVITLLITDYLIFFSGLTAFSPVTGLCYIIAFHLQVLIVFFLQDTSSSCGHFR